MKLSLAIIAMWLVMVFGQRTDCPKELAQTDDCADVINANACYNQFRFNGAQTLTCVGGKDAKDKQRKVSTPSRPNPPRY